MSISFGGLGIISLRRPFAELVGTILGKGDIQSIFCLVVFCIIFLVLAYLTNPSETSFRAYLTELSFRQHLSRLDNIDDDTDVHQDDNSDHISFRHGTAKAHPTLPFESRSPFHFANRASVSLRTPKHVFHSFGIFTIAAILPAAKSDRSVNDHRDTSMISDSWFVGAFGKWWRGGVLEAWYQDVIARSGNVEESWSSGIMGMKTLDRLNDCSALPGLPISTKNLPPNGPCRGSPPRLRNRDKSSQRTGLLHSRSSTPPPLPKAASLPLHTPRTQAHTDRGTPQTVSPSAPAQPVVSNIEEQHSVASGVGPQPTSFDQSPRVIELLHQISLSNSSILDLRAQLADYQAVASQSRAQLQQELDSCRDRKKQEDTARNDLKSRTKALDDSKRAAESLKRDAEKKLRAAETAREDALRRMLYLDKEIATLQQRLLDDEDSLKTCRDIITEEEQDVTEAIARKGREIKVAEDNIAALNSHARDLEDTLNQRTVRLRLMREQAELRRRDSLLTDHVLNSSDSGTWPSSGIHCSPSVSSRSRLDHVDSTHVNFPSDGSDVLERTRRLSDPRDCQTPGRPLKLLLGGMSNFSGETLPTQRGPSYFDHPLVPFGTRPPQIGSFSPFAEIDRPPPTPAVVLSPSTSPAFISSAVDNIDGSSRSFRSENDAFLERDWRDKGSTESPSHQPENVAKVPVCISPIADEPDHDPFEVRVYTPSERDHLAAVRNKDSLIQRHNSDPSPPGYEVESVLEERSSPKRWFSMKEKPKKGLNPDAKVFDMFRKSQPVVPLTTTPAVYDALNPTGLGFKLISSTTSDSSTLLRAFAPSPAEREALHRALGGSTNASLERLPSLSDVGGSIPPSPNHIHTQAVPTQRDLSKIPSWLQSLPRIRKPNFSPWDDEEPAVAALSNGNGRH
ncbi:hypothetical protein E1B28_000772 [Marasmius oreades]|uniref:Uncharacterized protein n=1 Tax=Marasmius oreades TaxID=181124 RepID=A0A9P7V276_9AGAR|nr:uncharacterized protein E1B28_000772 [Marasmius oreades]KAG7098872.1 hypothetical protein E1B28_000772 [Marasmius oreades]